MFEIMMMFTGPEESVAQPGTKGACFAPGTQCCKEDGGTSPTTARKTHTKTKWEERLREKDILRYFSLELVIEEMQASPEHGVSCGHYCCIGLFCFLMQTL